MAIGATKTEQRERKSQARERQVKRSTMNEIAMPRQHRGLLDLQRSAGNRATSNFLRQGSFALPAHGIVQRKCSSCAGGANKCADCGQAEEIQRKPANQQTQNQPGSIASAVSAGLDSQTVSLDPSTRRSMESHFGQDLGHVRVHTDGRASDSAHQVSALAYTVGSDIVFGSGQYKPHTEEGRRLLAHELTHTIQQENGASTNQMRIADPADVSEREADTVADAFTRGQPVTQRPTNAALGIARQSVPGTTKPAGQPATQQTSTQPAPPQGWLGCLPDKSKTLPAELSAAIDWVQEAVNDLSAKEKPAHTSRALSRYLSSAASDISGTILPKLKLILTELKLGATNFQCQTEKQCLAQFPGGAVAFSGQPITLCPSYFGQGNLDRITTLIHEAGHNAGLAGNVIEEQWHFPGIDQKDRLSNTESYAAFVRSNKYPSLAPYEFTMSIKATPGLMFPGGQSVSPRFLVRIEEDFVLKRRIFRFMDLHLNVGIDIDSSGSILGRAALNTRSFAPLTLTKVPFYLDLGAGGVVGSVGGASKQFQGVSDLNLNVAGLSVETGLGVHSGRFGLGVSYTHVFNFLKKNPDINEVLINGEIRF